MTTQIENNPGYVQTSCCCSETPAYDNLSSASYDLQKIINTICRIALGVIAAICLPVEFAISFGAGVLAGIVYEIKYESLLAEGNSKPVCAQGNMEFLSGKRFPMAIATLATAAYIAEHIYCHPEFHSPFCGLFLGFWAGGVAVQYTGDLANYVFADLGQCFNKI